MKNINISSNRLTVSVQEYDRKDTPGNAPAGKRQYETMPRVNMHPQQPFSHAYWIASGVLMASCLVTGFTNHLLARETSLVSREPVENGPTSIDVETVVLRPLRTAEVPAQQTGLLQEYAIVEGEQVRAGQLLATLDARVSKHYLQQARLEYELATHRVTNKIHLRYAEKGLEVARAELARSKESIDKFAKSISKSQLDVEQLTVEKLLLEAEQARHNLELEQFRQKLKENELEAARLQLEQHQLHAPFDGTVASLRGQVGEWVEMGKPVLRLVTTDRLRAEGFVSADDLENGRPSQTPFVGRPVTVLVTLANARKIECQGILKFVSPEMDPVSKQVRLWAEINNDQQQLRPGQRGQMQILPHPETP